MERKGPPRSIKLPETIEVFRNLNNAKRFAIDIGGSLTKIAYYSVLSYRRAHYSVDGYSAADDHIYELSESARLHFVKFETKYIERCLDFVKANLVGSRESMIGKIIKATGGGAYKYAAVLQDKLGLKVEKEDEMGCLIKGCNFLLKNITDEAFTYHRHGIPEYEFQTADPNIFPYMLVNIGSGVSILKVESEDSYERIGGTATGGGTFWGLGTLLTKAKEFDELLELAEVGDHRNTDMLVGDIYGGNYKAHGLDSDLIASAFGKICYSTRQGQQINYSDADVARSLLFTISNDIGQIASLYAMIHNLKKVYFGGYFLRNHPLSMHTISFSINYWSKGKVQSLFLRHEGYLGAIGAFLKGAEQCGEHYSWQENYVGSSALEPQPVIWFDNFNKDKVAITQLELDRESQRLFCPLLANPASYIPDTVDLNADEEARNYWLDCFEKSIDKYVDAAMSSQADSETAPERAKQFKEKYIKRLHKLRQQPFAYGNLTVRSLLETIEHYMREFDFPDPYVFTKQSENEAALSQLQERLNYLDSLTPKQREVELIIGLLAGNMFDWGARAVVDIMVNENFGLNEAREKIPGRPWIVDHLDLWLERLKGPPHKQAAIFVDNSGVDIILGILPFTLFLLSRGTNVMLCANSEPALNDVTYKELKVILHQAGIISPKIKEVLDQNRLIAMETAQTGPCLDLSRLDCKLAKKMSSVDLIIIEGMGRAVHTNLDAKFTCESLRAAVIKNKWLAERLGGQIFAVILKYEPPYKP
uniref:4'-phosphopantetheine phosphatase n=2 Tax=Triatoma infestans TaxID=30076 RepID=A0A023F3Z0_TRIIF